MSQKKTMPILRAPNNHINYALTGEDRVALSRIEGFLAKRYGRSRVEVSNSECLRYCLTETVKVLDGNNS
jgi:hypothetical protein